MTEANNNANSSSEFNLESCEINTNDREKEEQQASATGNEFNPGKNDLPSSEPHAQLKLTEQKMNWQKVAHKLREYNRKLLKKVFRLEQELADIDNKFTKYVEKSRSNDVLLSQQEQEIRKYQEQIESFDRTLAGYQESIERKEVITLNLSQQQDLSQQQIARLEQEIDEYKEQTKSFDCVLAKRQATIDQQEIEIAQLSKQRDLSQQQTALIERDCALLQESYNHQAYELTVKDKEIAELQNKLSQQQRVTAQYQAELKREREKQNNFAAPAKEPTIPKRQNYSSQKTIKPWSTSVIPEKNIILPKTKSQSIAANKFNSSDNKTAAQIATWSTSQVQEKQDRTKKNTAESQFSVKAKPKSLAAVDLPTFPRPV